MRVRKGQILKKKEKKKGMRQGTSMMREQAEENSHVFKV